MIRKLEFNLQDVSLITSKLLQRRILNVEQCVVINFKGKEHDAYLVVINVRSMLAQDQITEDQAGKQGVKKKIGQTPISNERGEAKIWCKLQIFYNLSKFKN